MEIEIIRTKKKEWGVDGMLRIRGEKVCDTVEHPTKYLPEGRYELRCGRHPFRRGDGPMLSLKGEIIVGENACPGLVIHSAYTYHKLCERLRKTWERGQSVVLKIR